MNRNTTDGYKFISSEKYCQDHQTPHGKYYVIMSGGQNGKYWEGGKVTLLTLATGKVGELRLEI